MNYKDKIPSTTKESPMREVLHKTTGILKGRGKVITLREHGEEPECITDVQKNFLYLASPAEMEETQPAPKVHLRKSFDSISRDEKFCFRVKGAFYVHHGRRLMKVDYCHSLRIKLHWKIAVCAPKKTVTMA